MPKAWRRFIPVLLGALALVLSGCAMLPNDETLYSLPKLPDEYESLETLIDQLLAGGAEYAAPTSGSNLQSVQMVDLDGDGVEEAMAFLRKPNDEKPMKIYVFRAVGESYEQYCVIEGTSNSIYSINYTDVNGDGWREILSGSRGNLDVQNLTVYSIAGGEPQQLLVTGYSRYAVRDLDGDERQDLVVIRSDEENAATADYYAWNGAEIELYNSLRLSSSIAELSRLTAGTLAGGENALFVTGVAEESISITDILAVREGKLQSVTHGSLSERGGEVYHFLGLYPGDVDGDGVTEVPDPVAYPRRDAEGADYYRICWRQFDGSGRSSIVCQNYQSTQDGWSLILPESWGSGVTVERTAASDSSAVVFSRWNGLSAESDPFLTIYTYTGISRDTQATRSGRFLLRREADVVYAAELTDGALGMIDEQTLRDSFDRITAEWTTGEN